jgi:hypothetical protein
VFGVERAEVEIAGLPRPLSLTVPIGQIRAIVSPVRRISRAIADAVTGLAPVPGRVAVTGPAGGRVRLVPSDGALLPHLTVLENILTARYSTQAELELRTRAAGYGLDGHLDRYPNEIPPGRRRLAGLARALQARPDALVVEDGVDMPSWGALLAGAWRGYEVRLGDRGQDEPHTPELLVGVATVLIVPTVDRATAFDARPLVLTGDGRSAA